MSIYKAEIETADGARIRRRSIDDIINSLSWAIDGHENGKAGLSSCAERSGFTGTRSAGEYRDMLLNGWDDGVKDVEGLEGLSTDQAERLTFQRNVGGVFPVVPAYLAGAPDSMLDVRPAPVDHVRGLTLIIDASFNANVESSTALQYAQSVMRLLAWLAAEQIETAVYVSLAANLGRQKYIYVTQVRAAGDVFQPERIASIVHPSFLRRAWFAQLEREHHEFGLPGTEQCNSGYGRSATATADELRTCIDEAYSVIVLPKVGDGDPDKVVREAVSVKLRQQ